MAYFRCTTSGSGKGNTLVVTCAYDLAGVAVTCTNGTKTYTKTCPSTAPYEVTFYGLAAGTWTVSATVSGNTYTTTVVITDYEAELDGFNWKTWVDLSENYTSSDFTDLDELLDTELAVRELMTIHACVDYLAGIAAESPDVETIIGNDLCAKWINLRDQALDTLYANTIIKGYMDSADKYFYGEWALMPQVPTMTSNTAPYGEVSASSVYSTNYAFQAFGIRTDGGSWVPTGVENEWVQYKFTSPKCVKRFSLTSYGGRLKDFKLLASNDNFVTEIELGTFTISQTDATNAVINYYDVDNENEYLYYRVKILTSYASGAYGALYKLQFYAWAPKGNVPVMTSNTAPYGEASAESASTNYPAYKAFNNSLADCWQSTNYSGSTVKNWIRYKFTSPVCLKKISYMQADPSQTSLLLNSSYTVWYSNDDTNRIQIGEAHSLLASENIGTDEIENDVYALYWWVLVESPNLKSGSNYYFTFRQLQFYGRELTSVINSTDVDATFSDSGHYSSNTFKVAVSPRSNIWYGVENSTTTHNEYGQVTVQNARSFKKVYIDIVEARTVSGSVIIQGSDDGFASDVNNISDEIAFQNESFLIIDISDTKPYTSYRVKFPTATSSGDTPALAINFVDFYGLDYSEKEFEEGTNKKWLYDHGVELETITISGTGTKGTDAIQLTAANSQAVATIDTTDYSLMRGKVGSHASGTNQLICGSGASNFTANNMPYNNGFDVSSVNGSNAVGVKQTANGILDATEFWLE